MASQRVPFNLHRAGQRIYRLVLNAASQAWPDLHFCGDGLPVPGAIHIPRTGATHSSSHFFYEGVRYGSANNSRGLKSQYGYIDSRRPVKIDTILTITINDHDGQERCAHFALVQRFSEPKRIPSFPWDL
jgi:hypothetical protein